MLVSKVFDVGIQRQLIIDGVHHKHICQRIGRHLTGKKSSDAFCQQFSVQHVSVLVTRVVHADARTQTATFVLQRQVGRQLWRVGYAIAIRCCYGAGACHAVATEFSISDIGRIGV